jgi:hypothetical protein
MTKRFTLCPECGACPQVDIDEREVRIGEAGNLVRLSRDEWNVLVRLVKDGELGEL